MRVLLIIVILTISTNHNYSVARMLSEKTKSIEPCFIQNKGQLIDSEETIRKDILYYLELNGLKVYFFEDRVSYVLISTPADSSVTSTELQHEIMKSIKISTFRFDKEFIGIRSELEISGLNERLEKRNYYLYHCSEGLVNVAAYDTLIYRNIYTNVDLIFFVYDGKLNYNYKLKENGNLKDIAFRFVGVDEIELNSNGSLDILTKAGVVNESNPLMINLANNSFVKGRYCLRDNTIKFTTDDVISGNLLIDPEILWSTYCGGSAFDVLRSISFDDYNNFVVSGYSTSTNFPVTVGAVQSKNQGNQDWVVLKFDNENNLLWSTYLGGGSIDAPLNVTFDKKNDIWIGGDTRGPGFPTTSNAFQKNYGGGYCDQALVKLSENGQLLYSTYLGGNAYDGAPGLACDNENCIWIGGESFSSDFVTTNNAFQKTNNHFNATIVRFDENGNVLLSSLLGGNDHDRIEGIVFDSLGNPIVCGFSSSTDFPIVNGIQSTNKGNFDAFIAKLNKNSGEPVWSTYFGGSNLDAAFNIINDKVGNIYFTGWTGSQDFSVTPNAFQSQKKGGMDYFVSKFDDEGQIIWSTFFGGNDDDGVNTTDSYGGGLDMNISEDIIVFGGITKSNDLTTTDDAIAKNFKGIRDGFTALLDTNGNPFWITYIGESQDDYTMDVDFDNFDNLFIVGGTKSPDFFITDDAFQRNFQGGDDGYILKLSFSDCDYRSFNFENFINTEKINFVGNAQQTDSTITITSPINWTNGAIWYDDKIPVKLGFQTNFSFRFSDGVDKYIPEDYPGADGICFILQNSDAKTIGSMGGGLGFKGIKNSLVVEFDTYKNTSEGIDDFNDPNENHVAVFCNGTNPIIPDHESNANLATNDSIMPLVPDGRVFFAKIEYELGEFFKVYLDTVEIEGQLPIIEIKGTDLSQLLDLKCGDFVWVGFSSATGNAYERHELLNWSMCAKPSGARVPNPQIKIGKDTVCENSIESYSSNISSNTSYNWNVSGGIINSGQGTGNVEIKWGNNPYGKLTLIHTLNSEGCSDTISKDIFIITKPEFGLSGSENLCIDQMGTYHAKKYDNYNYKWVTDEGEIIGNDTGDSVNIVWHEPGNFNLKLIMNHDFCDISGNVNKTVNVYNLPQITFDIIEDICINDPPFTLNIAKPKGGTYYGNGITSNIIFPKEAGVGTHEIIYSYQDPDFGCKNSASIQINILPAPAKPEIKYQFGKMLSSNSNFGNQWYLNGVKIDGANNQIYKPETSGTFTVKVIGENGCESESSNQYDFDITGIDEKFNNTYINIIPNPFTGTTTISFSLLRPGKVNITITDIMGKEIAKPLQKQFLEAGEHSIEFDAIELPAGVYICFLRAETYSQTVKMMVIK